MVRVLELFSGTGSVGKVCEEFNYEVVSLDLENATINTNILDWDYKKYPVGYFDYIHSSFPCNKFSTCMYGNIGRKLKSLNMEVLTREKVEEEIITIGLPPLNKSLEIIDYFKPKYFTMENPAYGRARDFIKDIDNTVIDYCKYGFPYKKPTRIWNNFNFKGLRCNNDCEFLVEVDDKKYHLQNCGKASSRNKTKKYHINTVGGGKGEYLKGGGNNKTERYRIPPKLIEDWISYME